MDMEKIENIIADCYNKGDMSLITTLLPYDIRKDIFYKKIKSDFIQTTHLLFIDELLTEEEADKLFLEAKTKEEKTSLYPMLSEKTKVLVIDEIEIEPMLSVNYISSIKDERIKYRIAMYLLVNNYIQEFQINKIIECISGETNGISNKKMFFEKLLEYYNDTKQTINSFNIASIISKFDDKDKLDVFKQYINKLEDGKINIFHIAGIIQSIPDVDKFSCLKYILENSIKDSKSIFDIDKIINSFPESEFYNILGYFIEQQKFMSYTYNEFLKKYAFPKVLEIVDYTIEFEKNSASKLVDEDTIAQIIEKTTQEEGVRILHKYVKEGFDLIKIIKNLKEVTNRYLYTDYIISKNQEITFEKIEEILTDIVSAPPKEYKYKNIDKMYIQKYNLNQYNYNEFISRFGYTTLKFISSKCVQKILKLDKKNFDLFLNLFDSKGTKLTKDDINSICNSFLQRQFKLENEEDYSIFSRFEDILRIKDENSNLKITELLVKINSTIDLNDFLEKHNTNIDSFIESLLNNNEESINTLHDITQLYIMKKREIYVKERLDTIFDKLTITKKAEKSFFKKAFIESNSISNISATIRMLDEKYLTEAEQVLLNNRDLLKKIIGFKKKEQELDKLIKSNLKTFESLLNKLYEHQYRDSYLENVTEIIYDYFPIEPTDEDLLDIIIECDIDRIAKEITTNQNTYNELVAIIQKYKLLGWHNTFGCFEESAEITFNNGTIASIISYFDQIREKTSKNNSNLTTFLDYANCYDSLSKVYSYLIGKDNYSLIAANEGKNKSNISKVERIKRIPSLVKGMYERVESTIPPIDKDYETKTGKKINVVIGNSTNMINLSYGERTHSCLRIGGAFNNLFEFCIHNKNGFHVRFTDPETNKFITRVSGIRNGNTIFLNELRECEHESYNNEEVIQVLKKLSEELIEQTKGEECPIENVVISHDYAMHEYKKTEVSANLKDHKDAFFGLRFNIDLDGKLIVLKSKYGNQLQPYKFGSNLPKIYEPTRDRIMRFENTENAKTRINQIYLINGILGGSGINEITYEVPQDIKYFISGEDWFIYLDSAGNIHQYIMENSKQKEKAMEEISIEIEKLNNIKQNIEESITIGGLS